MCVPFLDNTMNKQAATLSSSYQEIKTLGLCVGIQGSTASSKMVNLAKVHLETCQEGWQSQQWARDSLGRFVNKLSGKCLEAGPTDALYAKAFIWTCHNESYQQWEALNDGRYQNKKYRDRYLGVAYCGKRSDYRRLELRSLEPESTSCGCAQTWNKPCSSAPAPPAPAPTPTPPTASYKV